MFGVAEALGCTRVPVVFLPKSLEGGFSVAEEAHGCRPLGMGLGDWAHDHSWKPSCPGAQVKGPQASAKKARRS